MRDILDSVIKADQGAQYVDDIGIAVNSPEKLINNVQAVFKSIQNAGLKLSSAKCHLGSEEVVFLGRTLTPNGVITQKQKIRIFWVKSNFLAVN